MQKAFKWLDAQGLKYEFHNYKTDGIDEATINQWLQYLPLEKLINSKGTTFRNLTDAEKKSCNNVPKAIALMIKNPSLIKRPIWDFGKGKYYVGFIETAMKEFM